MKVRLNWSAAVVSAAILAWSIPVASAQVPPDFPALVISSNGPVAPGVFIGTVGWKGTATNAYEVVLDHSATPLYCNPTQMLWRAVAPCGLIAEKGNNLWALKDETFAVVNTYAAANGYGLDGHDFKLLPNGDALILESENRPMDMSQIVAGGRPDAVLQSLVFQEIDASKQVVFQWRALDHVPILDSVNILTGGTVDLTHANAITIDPLDNNYLVSLRGYCQILKVSRTTGEIVWRLGGKHSDFSFVGEHAENAPFYFIGQHNIHRLINGDILFFDNGTLANEGSMTMRSYSRAVEYHLDEAAMTATLVWEYRHAPDILTPSEGIVKRFPNGNTVVGWVSAAQQGTGPTLTEVNAQKQVMYELAIPGYNAQTIFTKLLWNCPDLVHSATNAGIVAGQNYDFPAAGLSVSVASLSGSADNVLTASRHDDAVRLPQFSGKAPQVLVQRVTLSGSGIDSLTAELAFDLPANDYCFDTPLYTNPSDLTVYQRATPGQGVFAPLATTYDQAANKLRVTANGTGEFIFTYPDLAEVPLAPILYGQGTRGTVNQSEPVLLQWTPKGFARSYHVQVATDAGFNNLVVDQDGLAAPSYTLASVLTGTTYFWRANVSNTGGVSQWSTASFTAVPPLIQVMSPRGGEAWRRGLPYFIQWSNNIAENVAIELYKGGTRVVRLTPNAANLGAFRWSISFTNVPGSDYSIKVLSATNSTVFGTSATPFAIVDAPTLGAVTRLAGGQVQFSITAAGAPTASVLVSTDLVSWQRLQSVTLSNGAGVFTDDSVANLPSRYYRVVVP